MKRAPLWMSALLLLAPACLEPGPEQAPSSPSDDNDDEVTAEPVAVIAASVMGSPGEMAAGGATRAALAFSVYSDELEGCLDDIPVAGMLHLEDDADYEVALALQRCVIFSERGQIALADAPVPADESSFTIPLLATPGDDVLTGAPGAALAVADVVLYADDDGDGAFDETPLGADAFTDRVLGTSYPFREDDYESSFLVWRDGELSPLWKLYRGIYGCEDPPQGFSTVTLAFTEMEPWVLCAVDDRPLPIELGALGEVGALGCEADPDRHVPQRPSSSEGLPADAVAACVAADGWYDLRYTVDVESVCPDVERYDLVGCSDLTSEQACAATWWDLLGDAPAWWPCNWSDGTTVRFGVESAGAPSDGLDELFTLTMWDGLGLFPVEDLAIEVQLDDEGQTFTATAEHLQLLDHDGNGVFNVGDELVVSEPLPAFGANPVPGNYLVTVHVEGSVVSAPYHAWYAPVATPPAPALQLSGGDAEAPITEAPDDVALVTRGEDDEGAFAVEDLELRCYLGGEYPLAYAGAAGDLSLYLDVNGDGLFGAGDMLLAKESEETAVLTPEMLQTFGAALYCDLSVDVGVNAWASAGSFGLVVE